MTGAVGQLGAQVGQWAARPSNISIGRLHGLAGLPHSMVAKSQESKEGLSWPLYDLALEVTQRHFHCTVFTCTYGAQESNLGCVYSKRGGSRSREGLGREDNYRWTLGGCLRSALSCWGLSNLGAVSTESNSPELNRMANEDYIDFLLRSINKINWPEELSTDQGEPNINIY